MTGLVEKMDKWKYSTMLKINIGIAAFILIAHIGSALFTISESQEPKPNIFQFLHFDDYVAFFILISALLALLKSTASQVILRIHTILILILAIDWLFMGISFAIGEIPEGNFAWNPILFAFLCAYPVYLIRRVFLSHKLADSKVLYNSHIITALGSLVISGLIIYKAFQTNV